jgi:DNA-directed RNA polymerase specialized sigma24 family protein
MPSDTTGLSGYRAHSSGGIWGVADTGAQVRRILGAEPMTESADVPRREVRAPWVALACYAVAVVSLAVSLNTSWRFFDLVLHIPSSYGERYVMFAVAELALVVCGAGMAVNVHRDGRPGSFQVIVWSMCAAMAYMAWAESSTEEAVGRILLGPVLGTVMLHLGLGLELRARHQHTSTVARIGRELRERCLSRLGLADDGRDAAQRTRDRKAYAAAALSRQRWWPWSRKARLERALLAAGVADDPVMRDRMLARLAVIRHAHELSTLAQPSPWHPRPTGPAPNPTPRAARGSPASVAHERAARVVVESKRTKQSEQVVAAVLQRHAAGRKPGEIADEFDLHHSTVNRIIATALQSPPQLARV